jgi:hypothetical protein
MTTSWSSNFAIYVALTEAHGHCQGVELVQRYFVEIASRAILWNHVTRVLSSDP